MKTIYFTAFIFLQALAANASTNQAVEMLKLFKTEVCKIELNELKGTNNYSLIIKKGEKTLGIKLSNSTKYSEDLSSDGNGFIKFKQTAFMRSWGPFQYSGDRTYRLKLTIKDSKISKVSLTAKNDDFPWTKSGSIICK